MPALLNKKAQLKIQQMSFMLIAVSVFFVFVLLFYIAIEMQGLKTDKLRLEREQAIGLVTKIASSPEFTFEEVPRAIDFDKVMVLRNRNEYNKEDKTFWGVKGIVIKKLYPGEEKEIECTLKNYPDCNVINLFTDGKGSFTYSYITLCKKQSIEDNTPYNNCGIGLMMLETE